MVTCLNRGWSSFTGHPLAGDRLLRLIIVDEAGISRNENICVVAGVVVNADSAQRHLEQYLGMLRDLYIPEEDRNGFVFHCKDISAGNKYFADEARWPPPLRA